MLLRSSSTPFMHSFFSASPPPSPAASSLLLRRAFSDGHLPSLHHPFSLNSGSGLHTELSFSVYNTFSMAPAAAPPAQEPVQEEEDQQEQELEQTASQPQPELPLFLARGLGIDRIASGLFTAGAAAAVADEAEAKKVAALDAQYRRMVDEQPGNALFLRNYAQFLHEVKGEARRAEEYYSRAMLADPGDGEITARYAKLVWEVHRDRDRSLAYFHKSLLAAPHDSHVLAAYASFLWEQEEEEDDDDDGGLGLAEGEQGSEHAGQRGRARALASVAV